MADAGAFPDPAVPEAVTLTLETELVNTALGLVQAGRALLAAVPWSIHSDGTTLRAVVGGSDFRPSEPARTALAALARRYGATVEVGP